MVYSSRAMMLWWLDQSYRRGQITGPPPGPMAGVFDVAADDLPQWLPLARGRRPRPFSERKPLAKLTCIAKGLRWIMENGLGTSRRGGVRAGGRGRAKTVATYMISPKGRKLLAKWEREWRRRKNAAVLKDGTARMGWSRAYAPDGSERYVCPRMNRYGWHAIIVRRGRGEWVFKLRRPDGTESPWLEGNTTLRDTKSAALATFRKYYEGGDK